MHVTDIKYKITCAACGKNLLVNSKSVLFTGFGIFCMEKLCMSHGANMQKINDSKRFWDIKRVTDSFAETLEKAPEFDGHTPADVLNRLLKL